MKNDYTKEQIMDWHKEVLDLVKNERVYSDTERKKLMNWLEEVGDYLLDF